jgi:hypothetical protein
MNNFDRIADNSGYKSWNDLVEQAKETSIELKIPNYLFYGHRGNQFMHEDFLATIKQINFKLEIKEENKIFLTRDKKSDIIESQNNEGEQNV